MPFVKGAGGVPPDNNKGRTYPKDPPTDAEVQALIRECSKRAPTGIRNRALITVLYRTGARIAEALSLLPKDVDMETGEVRILRGKGHKQRIANIDPGAMLILEKWIEKRPKELKARRVKDPQGVPIFCTMQGKPMSDDHVRNLLRKLRRKAGIKRRIHPHGFRAAYASNLLREGVLLPLISKMLGHSKTKTTAIYLDGFTSKEALAVVRKLPPWNPKV